MIDFNFSSLAVSATDMKCANGFIHGRPLGGTGILWRKSLANIGLHIKLLDKDNVVGRYTQVMLSNKLLLSLNEYY